MSARPPAKRRRHLEVDERAQMLAWMKQQIAEIQASADRRVELAKLGGEHPMPHYALVIQHYAGMQLDAATIARMLNIPYATLMLHYENDIELGQAHVSLQIAENMVRIATSTRNKDAARVGMDFLGRTNKKMRNTKKFEIEAPNETRVIDSSKLTPEQRQQLRDMIESTMRKVDESEAEADAAEDQPGAGLSILIGS